MQFKRIVVALDGTALSESLLAPVAILAKRLQAELLLVRTTWASEPLGSRQHPRPPPTLLEIQTSLERFASCLTAEGLPVRTALPLHAPDADILAVAAMEQADLIAMATHGGSGLSLLGHPSTTWQVLTHSAVPVLIWRAIPAADAAASPAVSHRWLADSTAPILVPLDGSFQAERALTVAQALARVCGNPLLVVRAAEWPILSGPSRDDPAMRAAISRGVLEQAEHYLTLICQEVTAAGLHATSKSALEAPLEFILRCVRGAHPCLVVLTAGGRGRLGHVGLGNVAQSVLSQAEVPMLLVP